RDDLVTGVQTCALPIFQALAKDAATLRKAESIKAEFNVVLLQAAADSDSLAAGGLYGDVLAKTPTLRLLVTTSANDRALGRWYQIGRASCRERVEGGVV